MPRSIWTTDCIWKRGGWTAELRLAKRFPVPEDLFALAKENKISSPAVACIAGEPPHAVGFLWQRSAQATRFLTAVFQDISQNPGRGQ